jgi:hypothetical protein
MNYYQLPKDAVLDALHTTEESGLSSHQAEELLKIQ